MGTPWHFWKRKKPTNSTFDLPPSIVGNVFFPDDPEDWEKVEDGDTHIDEQAMKLEHVTQYESTDEEDEEDEDCYNSC